jgi:uncharacterized protein (DUF736 family)
MSETVKPETKNETKVEKKETKYTTTLQERKIGAIWKRKNEATGEVKLSLQFTVRGKTYNCMAYKNPFKEDDEDNNPHYKIFLNEEDYLKIKAKQVPVDGKVEESATSDCEL